MESLELSEACLRINNQFYNNDMLSQTQATVESSGNLAKLLLGIISGGKSICESEWFPGTRVGVLCCLIISLKVVENSVIRHYAPFTPKIPNFLRAALGYILSYRHVFAARAGIHKRWCHWSSEACLRINNQFYSNDMLSQTQATVVARGIGQAVIGNYKCWQFHFVNGMVSRTRVGVLCLSSK
ncbi:hypothetical protein CEXT_92131 [Caerostris extrusa]|uniref:Uncharacterized protein n=1 Tax=Caerostris extrusa TaxID=172846 RepID=A0AAV4WK75_CAEEX|nr:hypothetical protein CEXT_92131 [Caerostris extrusa]